MLCNQNQIITKNVESAILIILRFFFSISFNQLHLFCLKFIYRIENNRKVRTICQKPIDLFKLRRKKKVERLFKYRHGGNVIKIKPLLVEKNNDNGYLIKSVKYNIFLLKGKISNLIFSI